MVTFQWLDKRFKANMSKNNFLNIGRNVDIFSSYMYLCSLFLKMKEFWQYDLPFLRYRGSKFTFLPNPFTCIFYRCLCLKKAMAISFFLCILITQICLWKNFESSMFPTRDIQVYPFKWNLYRCLWSILVKTICIFPCNLMW